MRKIPRPRSEGHRPQTSCASRATASWLAARPTQGRELPVRGGEELSGLFSVRELLGRRDRKEASQKVQGGQRRHGSMDGGYEGFGLVWGPFVDKRHKTQGWMDL